MHACWYTQSAVTQIPTGTTLSIHPIRIAIWHCDLAEFPPAQSQLSLALLLLLLCSGLIKPDYACSGTIKLAHTLFISSSLLRASLAESSSCSATAQAAYLPVAYFKYPAGSA